MAEVLGVLGPYYEKAPDGYRDKRQRGQIYEAVIPYSGGKQLQQLKVVSAEEGSEPWCVVEPSDLTEIRRGEAVPELGLHAHEALLVREAKARRAIILSTGPADWSSGTRRSEAVYLLAPIYSFKADDGEEHRSRVKAFAYNTLFWLPGDGAYRMYEGCVRLDRVQPVHTSLLDAKPVRLSTMALDALTAWYGAYLNGRIPERICAYRDAALAQLE
jgi:hypothetical protein